METSTTTGGKKTRNMLSSCIATGLLHMND